MNRAKKAMQIGIDHASRPYTYTPELQFALSGQARALAAQLINTVPDNVAIVPSVSYGLQIAANNLPLSAEGEVLILEEQFPSNVYAWREKTAKTGGKINVVARPFHRDWTAAVLEAIGPQTEIIALPAVHWTDGSVIDLEVIGMAGRAVGAKLVLDLSQSLGALPFDIEVVQPDFMVSAGYKWLMSPYTLAYVYAAPRWQGGEPLEYNWMNRAGSEDYSRLVDYQDGYQPGARRYDMGETANPAQLLAGIAALEQLLEWGVENIRDTLLVRTQDIADRARSLGLSVLDDKLRGSHFLGVEFSDGVPDTLKAELAADKVFVAVRGNALRIAPHLYNTDAHVDRLFEVLQTHS